VSWQNYADVYDSLQIFAGERKIYTELYQVTAAQEGLGVARHFGGARHA